MADRRILVFDEAGGLATLAQRAFAQLRFEVVVCRTLDRLLERIRERLPSLLLFSVEAPKRTGFTAFTRARLTCGRPLPMILCSASLPRSELDVHAMQRWHASAYLEAADMTPERLLEVVSEHVRLGSKRSPARASTTPSPTEASPRRRRARGPAPRRTVTPEATERRDEQWVADLLSQLNADGSARARTTGDRARHDSQGDASARPAQHSAEAETADAPRDAAGGERRRRAAAPRTRRSARALAAADELASLRDRLESSEQQLRGLRCELAEARQALATHERRTRLLAEKLLTAERCAAELRTHHEGREALIAELRKGQEQERQRAHLSLEREQQRHREALERVRIEQRAALDELGQRAAADAALLHEQTRASLAAAAERHTAELAALRSAHERELAGLRKRFEEQREAERHEFEAELQTLEALLDLERDDVPHDLRTRKPRE